VKLLIFFFFFVFICYIFCYINEIWSCHDTHLQHTLSHTFTTHVESHNYNTRWVTQLQHTLSHTFTTHVESHIYNTRWVTHLQHTLSHTFTTHVESHIYNTCWVTHLQHMLSHTITNHKTTSLKSELKVDNRKYVSLINYLIIMQRYLWYISFTSTLQPCIKFLVFVCIKYTRREEHHTSEVRVI
jgi:hypothetical protein